MTEDRADERDERPLRVLLYADLRTSHARGWLTGLRRAGVEVCPVSSELTGEPELQDVVDPVGLVRRSLVRAGRNLKIRAWVRSAGQGDNIALERIDPLQSAETVLMQSRLLIHGRTLRRAVARFQPQLVHALRFPYEGVIALSAVRSVPVVATSWGQDFAMQAARDPLLRSWLRRTVPRLGGLFVDNPADVDLARGYGLPDVPVIHAAGNFGIDDTLFFPAQPEGPAVVVYPRGVRNYVRHRTFLDVVRAFGSRDDVRFVGVGLAEDDQSCRLADEVGSGRLTLLPALPRRDFAALLRSASVVLSPAITDGAANSMLEALACGAYVIAGDVPSVRAVLQPFPMTTVLDPRQSELWVAELQAVLQSQLHLRARRLNPARLPEAYTIEENLWRVPEGYRRVAAR